MKIHFVCLQFNVRLGTRESVRRKVNHGGQIVLWYWQHATNLARAIMFVVCMSSSRVLMWVRPSLKRRRKESTWKEEERRRSRVWVEVYFDPMMWIWCGFHQNNNILLQNWPQGLGLVFQIDRFKFYYYYFFMPWGPIKAIPPQIQFVFFPALTPSVKSLRPISTIVPIGMLDLSSTLALTLSVKWAFYLFIKSW